VSISADLTVDAEESSHLVPVSEPGSPGGLRRRFRKLAIGIAVSGMVLAGIGAALLKGRREA